MHGLIFVELKKYCDARLGPEGWDQLLDQSGMGGQIFVPLESYPDREALTLVRTASVMLQKEQVAVLEDFGEFIAPDLIRMYARQIKREWRTLEFLCNVEDTIHATVRRRNNGAEPPQIKCAPSGPDEVTIVYTSQRRLCALARGLIRGVASSYQEQVSITESGCMLAGASQCRLIVRVARP